VEIEVKTGFQNQKPTFAAHFEMNESKKFTIHHSPFTIQKHGFYRFFSGNEVARLDSRRFNAWRRSAFGDRKAHGLHRF
jgi:hypothetical protein